MKKHLEYFDGAFDSTVAEKVKPENKPYVAYSKTEGVIYTIIPNESGTMYTIYRVVKKDISNLTYNEVDLGLSVKWADRNVGATSPEHYGSYFQWGDVEGFTYDGKGEITAAELAELLNQLLEPEPGMEITVDNVYDILTMMLGSDPGYDVSVFGLCFSIDKLFNWENYKYCNGSEDTMIKYCTHSSDGIVDNKTVLESEDDAATTHMGSGWRMPTITEIQELISNTTPTFFDLQGNEYSEEEVDNSALLDGNLKGVCFTASNGNSIFIPAAGECFASIVSNIGTCGSLWSSSLSRYYEDPSYNAPILYYQRSGGILMYIDGSRDSGLSVRGVKP